MILKSSLYLLPKFSRVPLTIVLIPLISTIVNGTLLNFGNRYEDNLRVIFDQCPKLDLGLDALSNQKILNGIVYTTYTLLCLLCIALLWRKLTALQDLYAMTLCRSRDSEGFTRLFCCLPRAKHQVNHN
jgi:hypothetical protein